MMKKVTLASTNLVTLPFVAFLGSLLHLRFDKSQQLLLELINCKLVFTLWSRNNGYGQLTPDADWVCLDSQNVWGAVDFSGAHIMPCKKY